MRVSVELEDADFVNVLVAVLRQEGHLVVEPEIAEVKITRRQSPTDGIRIEYALTPNEPRSLGVSALLPSPITVRRLATALRRLMPT